MGKNFDNYEVALQKINLQKLEDRRNDLSLKFAKKCTQNERNISNQTEKPYHGNKEFRKIQSKSCQHRKVKKLGNTKHAKDAQ